MNPIKTPQEILFEEAGIPHLAGGGRALSEGAELLFKQAAKKLESVFGRKLTSAETSQLMQEVQATSKPTSTVRQELTPPQRARNQFELASDPNLINPNTARDEFLSQAMFGRGVRGTSQTPKTLDISLPEVGERIEAQQMSGALDKLMPNASQGSTTPGADYLAKMSEARQNFELANSDVVDKLKESFYKETNRFPDAEELDQLIAAYNPLRHQYGPKGASVITERPPTAKGMQDWREEARMEGIPESYLYKRPGDYRQNLKNELEIEQGITPATRNSEERVRKARDIEPTDSYIDPETGAFVKVYPTEKASGGHITPREMLAEMVVKGHKPQKLAGGGQPTKEQQEDYFARQAITQSPNLEDLPYLAASEGPYQARSSEDVNRWMHEKAAKHLGKRRADALFGGPTENTFDRVVMQTMNPANLIANTADSMTTLKRGIHQDDPGLIGSGTMGTAFGVLPFVGRAPSAASRVVRGLNPLNPINLGIGFGIDALANK